jgi:hypothetical protein
MQRVDVPCRRPHGAQGARGEAQSTQRGMGGAGRQLMGCWEVFHGVHPRAMVQLANTIKRTISQRGGRAMEMRSSLARSTAPELNDREGGVQQLDEQLQALANLLDLRTRTKNG